MFIKVSQTSLSFGQQSNYRLLQLNLKIPYLKFSTQRVSSRALNGNSCMNGKTHQNEKFNSFINECDDTWKVIYCLVKTEIPNR